MSQKLLSTNQQSALRVTIKGRFNGVEITGGTIGPLTAEGTRWVNLFHKKGGAYSGGQILPTGEFQPECHTDDLAAFQAVYNAAVEQYS